MTDCQLQDPCSSCFFSLLDYQLLGWHLCVSSFCVTGEGHNWLAHWTCSFIEEGKTLILVSLGSPSRGGDVTVYVSDINHPSLPTLFVLFLCLFLSLWPFQLYFIPQISLLSHSGNPDITLCGWLGSKHQPTNSHSGLLVLLLLYWSF